VLKDPDAIVGYHTSQLPDITPQFANPPVTTDATLDAVLHAMDEA
jgi:hypothetical protein